jgi:hypothetical protein
MPNLKSFDTRFAIVTIAGGRAYPYMKREQKRGLYGFALSAPGARDRHGQGHYTTEIEEVVRRVVFDGWGVRVKSHSRPGNTLRIGGRVVTGYSIAPDLEHLVRGAPTPPIPWTTA